MAVKMKEPRTPRHRSDPVDVGDGLEFVKVWQKASSKAKVAELTGLTVKQATMLAAHFRKHGAAMRKFGKTPRYDYKAIAQLAKSLNGAD